MRYQVPQFVDIEDRIFGPLTLKQFIYVLGGAGLSVLAYLTLPFFVAAPIIGVAMAFSGSLAFYKVNNKPFVEILQAAFKYMLAGRLYLWRRIPKPIVHQKEAPQEKDTPSYIPTVRHNNLTNLAFNLSLEEGVTADANPLKPGKDTHE